MPRIPLLIYAADQAAFLAGYVAASVTKTGKVGTFGGIAFPPVTDFMNGFAQGAAYYNEKNDTQIELLGWDVEKQDGLFTGNFLSTEDGRRMGEMLMDEGADILLPVAGNVGLGTAAVVKERGDAYIIGVDTDWVVFYPEYADIILTSIQKRLDVSVVSAVKSIADNTFTGARTLARWRTAVSASHPSTIWMLSSLRQPKQIWSRPRLTSSPVRSRPSHKSVQQLD